jgi:hypothetical protein
MSVNTLVKDGLLTNINLPVKIVPIQAKVGVVHYNPGLARDPKGQVWVAIRSCVTNLELFKNLEHPNHYRNYLHVGFLNENTLEISDLKEIVPEKKYIGFQWGIEDVRLFWRKDGMHGLGVIIPVVEGQYKLRQAEILIDHKAGTFKYIKDWGRPFGHAEKNWSPTEYPNPNFDFTYSPTEIVKDGKVIGEPNDLFIHNGTPLIEYQDGYISIGHSVVAVLGERTYAQIALKWDANGRMIGHSQFFHFNVGWRQGLKETIEFASGLLWSKGKEGQELLVGIGVKDEATGFCKIPIDKLKWEPYSDTTWYAWRWEGEPNRIEIDTPHIDEGTF